jgi:hypothetical protein
MAQQEVQKKQRRRSELDGLNNNHSLSERHVEPSSKKQCFLEGSLSLAQPSYEDMHERSKKATHAVNSFWETPSSSSCSSSSSSTGSHLTTGELELRRDAIVYLFAMHGYPPEGEWGHEFGVLKDIMTKLAIPGNNRTAVISVLRDALVAREAQRKYDANIGNKNKGRPFLIVDGTAEGILVCRALQRGIGITQTTCHLNKYRAKKNLRPISWSTVKGYTERSPLIKCQKRRTKKSGRGPALWASPGEVERGRAVQGQGAQEPTHRDSQGETHAPHCREGT